MTYTMSDGSVQPELDFSQPYEQYDDDLYILSLDLVHEAVENYIEQDIWGSLNYAQIEGVVRYAFMLSIPPSRELVTEAYGRLANMKGE